MLSYRLVIVIMVITIVCIYYVYNGSNKSENRITDIIKNNLKTCQKSSGTIISILKHNSKKHGNRIALQTKGEKGINDISYKNYYKNVKNFAESLKFWVGENINVGIIGHSSPGWYYGYLGTMMNGGISVPILATHNIEYIINDAQIEMLLVEDLNVLTNINIQNVKLIVYYSPIDKHLIEKFKCPVLGISNFMKERTSIDNELKSSNIATIVYTSDKKQKGISVTHKNITSSLGSLVNSLIGANLELEFGEKLINHLPLNNLTNQLINIYLPIFIIGTIYFADSKILKGYLLDTIKLSKPTLYITTPHIYNKLQLDIEKHLEKYYVKGIVKMFGSSKIKKELGLNNCKLFMSYGDFLPQDTKAYFQSIGIELYNCYSMNEATGFISISLPNKHQNDSVGRPLMKIMISKDNEIMIKGNNLFKNYHNSKKKILKSGWYKTGDLGYLDANGYLYLKERKNELIQLSNGKTVEPHKIEELLLKNLNHIIEYVIIIPYKSKYLSALVIPKLNKKDKPVAKIREIDDKIISVNDCVKSKPLRKYIENAINETNRNITLNESKIKRHIILKHKFKLGDELTSTYRYNRKYINDTYKNILE
uniref:AMP-dependent synthetase/ligase domain-containing protein n=1 Tax=viral metagenome TaxID=1070528 RepID=A0A6C0EBQ0_9ZZZZ